VRLNPSPSLGRVAWAKGFNTPKARNRLFRKNSFSALEVIGMSFHYQTKVSQKGNPFGESRTFAQILKNMKGDR